MDNIFKVFLLTIFLTCPKMNKNFDKLILPFTRKIFQESKAMDTLLWFVDYIFSQVYHKWQKSQII